MTAQTLKRHYHTHSAAHTYIVGFMRDGKVYYVTVDWNQLRKWLKESRTASSRGGVLALRVYVPAADQKKALLDGTAKELCAVEELNQLPNKGDAFEKIVVETLTGTVWTKCKTTFYESGDMNLNGEEIQIKLTSATLTDEKVITNMLKKLGE